MLLKLGFYKNQLFSNLRSIGIDWWFVVASILGRKWFYFVCFPIYKILITTSLANTEIRQLKLFSVFSFRMLGPVFLFTFVLSSWINVPHVNQIKEHMSDHFLYCNHMSKSLLASQIVQLLYPIIGNVPLNVQSKCSLSNDKTKSPALNWQSQHRIIPQLWMSPLNSSAILESALGWYYLLWRPCF